MTPEERDDAHQFISDFSKEVYGFRWRYDVADWSREDFQAEIDALERQSAWEAEGEARSDSRCFAITNVRQAVENSTPLRGCGWAFIPAR